MPDITAESTQAPLMIEVENLVKQYGAFRAVDGISFAIPRGEILGFLGPNGAGKTTTMRILTGYMPATSGTARIGGADVATDSIEARRKIGYLPENAPLYLDMKVRPYLDFMAEIRRCPRARRRAAVDEVIQECGLTEVATRTIRTLSKGFRQRVGLAQALVSDPDVLVLDEPTVGLDPAQIQEIRLLIKGMAGRRTVILSTHILPEVSMTCQKVIIIHRGRIEAQGSPESLVSDLSGHEIEARIEGDADRAVATLKAVPGVARVHRDRALGRDTALYRITPTSGADPRAAIASAIVGAGLQLSELQSAGRSLEDVFLRVISSPHGESTAPGEEVA